MSVLRFRVMYEEDDSIYRDIEIKPSQTLIEFESVVISSYNLPVNGSGQFFMSNDNWQRGKKIASAPAIEEKKVKGKSKAQALPILVSFIDDPHQRFMYEYHGTQEFVFLIELMTVGGIEKGAIAYPVCTRSQGPSPFKKDDMSVHYSRRGVAAGEEEEEVDEEPAVETEPPIVVSEADEEELGVIDSEEHDLMEGDAIVEDKEEEGAADVDLSGEDDFDTENFDEVTGDEEEDDLP